MLKLCFKDAEPMALDIRKIMADLEFAVADENTADVVVRVYYAEGDILSVTLNGKRAAIAFGGGKEKFIKGLKQLVCWIKNGENQKMLSE